MEVQSIQIDGVLNVEESVKDGSQSPKKIQALFTPEDYKISIILKEVQEI